MSPLPNNCPTLLDALFQLLDHVLAASPSACAAETIACNFLLAPALSLLSWYVWAYVIYFVGVKLFGGIKTKSNHGELLRTIGFSSAPGLIRVFGITPELMTVTFIGSAFWMLACMVVAVKAALDYDSLWKAFGVVVVSWLFQAFFLLLVLVLFKGI